MSTTVFIVRVFSCEINLTVSRSGENSRSVGSLLLSINFTPDQSGLFWSEQFYSRSVEAFLIGVYILRAALNFLIETFFRASTIKNKTPSTQEDPWLKQIWPVWNCFIIETMVTLIWWSDSPLGHHISGDQSLVWRKFWKITSWSIQGHFLNSIKTPEYAKLLKTLSFN